MAYEPRIAAARFHEYSTSLDVNGSPLENVTLWRSWNVYVNPLSAGSGTKIARSGMML